MWRRLEDWLAKRKPISVVICAGVISIALVIIIVGLHASWPNWFRVESQWLILAAIPLLVGLFVAGYIQKVKLFGIEIEGFLHESIKATRLPVAAVDISAPTVIKETVHALENMSAGRIEQYQVITFIQGIAYYSVEAIAYYVDKLTHLTTIHVVDPNGHLICLLPISVIRSNRRREENLESHTTSKISDFIHALTESTILTQYQRLAVTTTVNENEDLIVAYIGLRGKGSGNFPVVNDEMVLVGLINIRRIERRIAEEVIKEYVEASKHS